MGGCCYGKVTDGIFGVAFPDQPDKGIFHNGQKVFPTQLYEAAGPAILALVLFAVKKHNFVSYVFAYPVLRFCIELLRGDDRGAYMLFLSPAQLISVIILLSATVAVIVRTIVHKRKRYEYL